MKLSKRKLKRSFLPYTTFHENGKEQLLLKSLTVFYKHPKHLDTLLFFLKNRQRRLSLRLLDWLVTNYAKKYNVVVKEQKNIDFMYLAYKNHLKSYSKKFFDAFARRQRIFYTFQHEVLKVTFKEIDSFLKRDDGFITTIAQMNAFRFFITSGVIDYAINHLEEIERDMISSQAIRSIPLEQEDEQTKKTSGFNGFVMYQFQMTVQFHNTCDSKNI
jgi:hypothetical protein